MFKNLDSYRYDSLNDDEWKRIEKANKGERKKNGGWFVYNYQPRRKKIYCTQTKIMTMYIPNMLDYLYSKKRGKFYERNTKYWFFNTAYTLGLR